MLLEKVWFSKFMAAFAYLMAVIYFGFGAMLFVPKLFHTVPAGMKVIFAFILIAYGCFRLIKLISRKTQPND